MSSAANNEVPSTLVNQMSSPSFSQFGPNAGFVRELYALFLADPSAVGDGWAEFFSNLGTGSEEALMRSVAAVSLGSAGATNREYANGDYVGATGAASEVALGLKVAAMVAGFRSHAHLAAQINPLSATSTDQRTWLSQPVDLSPAAFGIADSELEVVAAWTGNESLSIRALHRQLVDTYTGSVGFEFEHITNPAARSFLRQKIEHASSQGSWSSLAWSPQERKRMYQLLVQGETFESELHKKFVGQKRFSLQGGEALMPMLDVLFRKAAQSGVREAVVGMAHRGRLDVLTAFAGKSFESLFQEFNDNTLATKHGDGDVKYHGGSTGSYEGVQVTLLPNPSHLEFVNCVVEGVVRARQDFSFNGERQPVMPVLIHGDAAFAGQGVVFETLGLSAVGTYTTGGTVHVVINNQVGFTTRATEARSTVYCTDMAKAVEAPVFHVNGEDPEAACFAIQLAFEYRQAFGRDAIVDLYCYRKYGHNEGDDPTFTQPVMYKEIQAKKSVMTLFGERLVADGVMSSEEVTGVVLEFRKRFNDAEQRAAKQTEPEGRLASQEFSLSKVAPVSFERLSNIAKYLISTPEGFEFHPKLKKILEKRNEPLASASGTGVEWGLAEALAFGSLLEDGVSIRLSGQDCGRGTFSHRHLLLSDYSNARQYPVFAPLAAAKGVRFDIMNSILSEQAVMGFEFGYATVEPKSLTIWEAQFGDFANGAQVVIDQFLSSSFTKWGQRSGLTLLLPHGFEGQGPEHSSARLERFLQLCAQESMMVCYPTNAAQIFHLLRLQGAQTVKRPLVIMSPKSLLRAPHAACAVSDLCGKGAGWRPIISESIGKGSAKSVILCSGKVGFDALARLKEEQANAEVIRAEQLYPLPASELKSAIGKRKVLWLQEEPENMGAYRYIKHALSEHGIEVSAYAGRKAASSPATGSPKRHAAEVKAFLDDVVGFVK